MAKRYELSDTQWQRIERLLPGKAGDRGVTAKDNRAFVNGVLWVLRSGGALLNAIQAAGAVPVIPPHPRRRDQRSYDQDIYRERNIIERCFNRLKQFRRFATRYDRRASFFLAFVLLAASTLWLANVDSA